MRIEKVNCWVLRLPFSYPLMPESPVLVDFVEIEAAGGLQGHAMSAYPLRWAIKEFITREVAPAIVGMDVFRTEEVREKMFWQLSNKYFAATWSCAASLIDIALWDIKGKALNQPVWKLLGGAHERLPVYITFGLGTYTQEQLIEVAKILIADGQNSLKMVVGASAKPVDDIYGKPTDADILNDIRRVRALREAIGPDVELMIDANKNCTYVQALRIAKGVESCDLTWFEDPVLLADPRAMAHLRRQTTIPLAAGSTGTSDLINFREYLIQEAVDYAQPNVRDIGGYTNGVKAAALAQAFGVPLSMGGNWPHINMHLHGGVANGGRVEFH
ncbi:MAG: mandelate racemase/muconate lactonizing enzyme family protein, partial [Gemmatimonadetes bacterium]|nr:mandelate racemase/muconate lactonizing enzyme family protein [Gemmatimonadota bacterium]